MKIAFYHVDLNYIDYLKNTKQSGEALQECRMCSTKAEIPSFFMVRF